MAGELRWRPMVAVDLAAVEVLAAGIHVDHPEHDEVFAERLALCPAGCLVLVGGGGIAGYVVSHPGMLGQPPALDTLLGTLPAVADCWYIHDLALHASARGSGAAGVIVAALAGLAREHGLAGLSLIAVGRSPGFWGRQGFRPQGLPGDKLASYGPGATYMVRLLGPE